MTTTTLLVLATSLLLNVPAVAAERMNDKDLGHLVDRIASEEDTFRDRLDPQLKRSIYRSPTGEVNVERFLKDFSDAAERVKDRYKKDYSASIEVADLLRQASQIDAFLRRDHAATRGESEWIQFSEALRQLASQYGSEFPLPPGATVRRITDREVVAAAEGMSRDTERLKKALEGGLKRDKSIDTTVRTGVLREVALLKKDAETLRSSVRDGKPSAAQAAQLLARVAKVDDFIANTPAAAPAGPPMDVLGAKATLLAQAFNMASPLGGPMRR